MRSKSSRNERLLSYWHRVEVARVTGLANLQHCMTCGDVVEMNDFGAYNGARAIRHDSSFFHRSKIMRVRSSTSCPLFTYQAFDCCVVLIISTVDYFLYISNQTDSA